MNAQDRETIKHLSEELQKVEYKIMEIRQEVRYAPPPSPPPVIFITKCFVCCKETPHYSNLVSDDRSRSLAIATSAMVIKPQSKLHTCLVCGVVK